MASSPFNVLFALFTILGLSAVASATDCNPLKNTTCPADSALSTEHTWWLNSTLDSELWDMETGTADYTSTGADFSIKTENASTLLVSNFYIFFGIMETHVKMSPGRGIISSVILQSDDEDEIDWEWVGYNTSSVQSNFFGKGNITTSDRGAFHNVANADTEYHNYTSYWDKERLEWWIDGDLVRTVNYSEPLTLNGKNYPQTPCRVKASIWPVGLPSASVGNIEWGGGLVNWSDLPFTMSIQRIRVEDFSSGKEYVYEGTSGSFDSIKIVDGNSTAKAEIEKTPAKTLAQKWNDLGEGAHIGVYCGAAAAGGLLVALFSWWCIKQRRQGRLARALNDGNHGEELASMEKSQSQWPQTRWGRQSYQPVP